MSSKNGGNPKIYIYQYEIGNIFCVFTICIEEEKIKKYYLPAFRKLRFPAPTNPQLCYDPENENEAAFTKSLSVGNLYAQPQLGVLSKKLS